jgi:hypothetical protein
LATNYFNENEEAELYFNIVLKRKFINVFIINLVPLLTVATLLFRILLSTTSEKEKAEKFDFSILGVNSKIRSSGGNGKMEYWSDEKKSYTPDIKEIIVIRVIKKGGEQNAAIIHKTRCKWIFLFSFNTLAGGRLPEEAVAFGAL